KRQGQNGYDCEHGASAEQSRPTAQIRQQVLCEVYAAGVAALFLGALDAAKLDARSPHRCRARHAAADQVLRIRPNVKAQFRSHLALYPRAPQNGPYPGSKPAPESHTSSGVVPKIPAMTSAMRFHFLASVCSLRLPAAVRR